MIHAQPVRRLRPAAGNDSVRRNRFAEAAHIYGTSVLLDILWGSVDVDGRATTNSHRGMT